jgi:hypothetical protein
MSERKVFIVVTMATVISPTFYERNCANYLAPVKNLTFSSRTKKLSAKLLYKKAALEMLMKLTPCCIKVKVEQGCLCLNLQK